MFHPIKPLLYDAQGVGSLGDETVQIVPCLMSGTVIIVTLSLLALGAEQASSILKHLVPTLERPIFVNSKNISKSVLRDI
jgi:hypothetical protein